MSLGPISKRTSWLTMLAHIFTWYSQCQLNQAKDYVESHSFEACCSIDSLLRYSVEKEIQHDYSNMLLKTLWNHYEISFAWQYLLRQIFMCSLENSSEIILRQTIDLRVKKVISLLNSTTNHWKFLIQLLLGYWLFSM